MELVDYLAALTTGSSEPAGADRLVLVGSLCVVATLRDVWGSIR